MTARSSIRLITSLLLLLTAGAFIFVTKKVLVARKERVLATGSLAPPRIARDDKTPWTQEPVIEPPLAETLLQGGATVAYYEIDGNTPEELEASIAARNPAGPGTEG